MFIFDTDHLGIIQRQTEPEYSRVLARMAKHPLIAFYSTIISFHEQFLGWNAYISRARKIEGVIKGYEQLQKIIAGFRAAQVLASDKLAAHEFNALRKQKTRIGTMDLRIAAIARARSMTVLTRNVSDFALVPGLLIEDWTK